MSMRVSGKLFNVWYNLDQALIKYGYNSAKSCGIPRQSSKGLKSSELKRINLCWELQDLVLYYPSCCFKNHIIFIIPNSVCHGNYGIFYLSEWWLHPLSIKSWQTLSKFSIADHTHHQKYESWMPELFLSIKELKMSFAYKHKQLV